MSHRFDPKSSLAHYEKNTIITNLTYLIFNYGVMNRQITEMKHIMNKDIVIEKLSLNYISLKNKLTKKPAYSLYNEFEIEENNQTILITFYNLLVFLKINTT